MDLTTHTHDDGGVVLGQIRDVLLGGGWEIFNGLSGALEENRPFFGET